MIIYLSIKQPNNKVMSRNIMYYTLLQNALDTNIDDMCRLTEQIEDICIKDELDIILKNISKSWTPCKATIVSVIAKILHPDWDTRNHQIQLGGKFSLRTIDGSYVSKYLYKNGLYDTSTEFALTRSFEKAEPYNKKYSGMIKPKESKISFLNIVDVINTKTDILLLNDMLVYVLTFLKKRKDATTSLMSSIVVSSKYNMSFLDISNILDEINMIGSGSSVIPIIVAHTLLYVVQPYLWDGITIVPLKEHTSPDNHSKSFGDIEGFDTYYKPKIVIEVKHKIQINDTIVAIFHEKTKDEDVPLKFILTTAKAEKKVFQNNICVDTLNGFVISHLQHSLFHEKTICLKFVKELRTRIIGYKNVSLSIKENIDKIITSLLVSPSLS